ncbi:hypothetical protein UPYG_G00085590 [Umbra pygmaea]|uniref:U5 small nuclear ribonucleoprotein TSSC4 n=1 Tax=Umbra pygmaea TaxID=75934 RepID=A0ABD0Y1Z9_UMBPY
MCEQADNRDGACRKLSSEGIKLTDDLALIDSDPEEHNVSIKTEVEDLSYSSDDEEQPNYGLSSSPTKPAFSLTGGSLSFSNRSQSIFDCLESAAKLASSHIGQDNGTVGKLVSKCPLKRGVPDYLVNPERWTHYNLEDVPETSDHKNSMVAEQYIQSLQKGKESLMADIPEEPFIPTFNQGQSSSSEYKMVFSRPSRAQKDDTPDGNVLDQCRKSRMGLCHLDEEEEDGIDLGPVSTHRPNESALKRKRTLGENEEGGALNDATDQPPIGFIINRKVNRKNLRKTTEKDEN